MKRKTFLEKQLDLFADVIGGRLADKLARAKERPVIELFESVSRLTVRPQPQRRLTRGFFAVGPQARV